MPDNQQCNCNCSTGSSIPCVCLPLANLCLPNQGCGPDCLDRDAVQQMIDEALQNQPACTGCRTKVNDHMHIYINGNLTESGDGLTPETAVRSYDDAVLALARYDGNNLYNAFFHFADLDSLDARYPDMAVRPQHYSTFAYMNIHGNSHETTKFENIRMWVGSYATITNLSCRRIDSAQCCTNIHGKLTIEPRSDDYCIYAWCSAYIALNAEIYITAPSNVTQKAVFYCIQSSLITLNSNTIINISGNITVNHGTAYTHSCGVLSSSATFNLAGTVTGNRYKATSNSCINAGNNANHFPGTVAGTTATGGVYY